MGQYDWWNKISKYVPKNKGPTAINVYMMSPGRQMSEARGVYTGAGPDGQVNPNRPAMMVDGADGQHVLHEGELAVNQGNGKTDVVPNQQLSQAMGAPTQVAQTPQGQAQIADLQQRMALPGHALGGSFSTIMPFTSQIPKTTIPAQPKVDYTVPSVGTTPVATTPTAQPAATPTTAIATPAPAATNSAPAATTTTPTTATNATNTTSNPATNLDSLQRSALNFQTQTMQGNNPALQGAANKAEQDYNAQGQSQFGSMVQTGLQNTNMTEGARNALLVTGNRDISAGRSTLEGQLANQEQQAQQTAAQSVFSNAGALQTQEQETQSLDLTNLASAVLASADAITGKADSNLETMSPVVKAALQKVWNDSGQTGPMTQDFATKTTDSIANPEKTNALNADKNAVLGSDWYKALPVGSASDLAAGKSTNQLTQADVQIILNAIPDASPAGDTIGRNADGSLYIQDATGKTIYGSQTVTPTYNANGAAVYGTPEEMNSSTSPQYQAAVADYNAFMASNPNAVGADGKTLSMSDWLAGGGLNFNLSTLKNSPNATFVPAFTLDAKTGTSAAQFTASGAAWFGTNGTTQNTRVLQAGEKFAIADEPASIQGTTNTIPVGNYVAVDATHIKNVDTGVVYSTKGEAPPTKNVSTVSGIPIVL